MTFILTLIQIRKENIPLPQVLYMTTRNKRVPVMEREKQNAKYVQNKSKNKNKTNKQTKNNHT